KPPMPRRSWPQRRQGESYEEKSERRHEAREGLRRRDNVTTCRHLPRPAPGTAQSPRQREFLRRRKLSQDAGESLPGQEPEARTTPELCSQLEPRASILLQVTPALQTAQSSACSRHRWSIRIQVKTQPKREMVQTKMCISSRTAESGMGTQSPPSLLLSCLPSPESHGDFSAISPSTAPHFGCQAAEALHRELLLKQKMVILQELFSTLLQASEKSWQGQLNEDKLRCKLRALENQLQACTQSYSKECVKKILIEMEDQKQTYEQKAKEALQKMLEDKLQTEQQLQNSQRSLAETREDLALWKEHNAALKAELTKVATAHTELKNTFQALQSELQQADVQKERLSQELQTLRDEHTELLHRASALRSDNDRQASHIRHIQDKLQKEQEQKVTLEATISHLQSKEHGAAQNARPSVVLWTITWIFVFPDLIHNQNNQQKIQEVTVQRQDQGFTTQTPRLIPAKEKQNALLEHPEEEEKGKESLKDEVQKRTSQPTAKEKECSELRSELEALSEEYQCCLTRLRQCRDELNRSQGSQAQHGHWIPLLVAVAAVAIATFLASYRL
ncbi:T3JAM protein, partial [Grantiella picta]|nr:T3JAM protein [Grantiella picta]